LRVLSLLADPGRCRDNAVPLERGEYAHSPLAEGVGLASLTPYGSHRAKELPKSRELTVLSRTVWY